MAERRQDGDWTPCAQCGQGGVSLGVRLFSPDMDIEPVPLCIICRWTLFASTQFDGTGALDEA